MTNQPTTKETTMNITKAQEEQLIEAFHAIFDIKDAAPQHVYNDHEHYQVRDTAFHTLLAMDNLFSALGIERPSRSDNEGRDGANLPTYVPNMVVKGGELLPGDMLSNRVTVQGYVSIVKGGAKYAVNYFDGATGTRVLDRRRTIEIMRPVAS